MRILLSLSDENTSDTGGRISESTKASRSMCHHNDGFGCVLKLISVAKRARKGTVLDDFTIHDDTSKGTTEGFGTLKVVLGSIPALYANFQVRLRPPAQNTSLTGASAGNDHRWKQNRKSSFRCGRTGGTFCHASRRRARTEAQTWTDSVCHSSHSRLDIDFHQESSRISRGICGCCARSQGYSDLPTTFKTIKMFLGFSRICERPSPITRFVHHLGTVLDADRQNR